MRLTVGTAGYSYPAWVGGFYPPGTPAADQLAHYARHFAAVEINSTFYRVPTADQLTRMAAKVPAGFRFTLKVPRAASHDSDPADLPAFARAADALAATGQLAGLLVQVPEGFRNTASNRAWLVRIRELLRPHAPAVEFRHVSWDTPELPGWADRQGYTVVSVGVPALPQLFPAGLRVTAGKVYARLHGENPAAWYAGGPARYDYDYPDERLREWADALTAAASGGATEGLVFFNNCVGIQAVTNASRLAGMMRSAPGVEVTGPPPPAAAGRVRSLFDDDA